MKNHYQINYKVQHIKKIIYLNKKDMLVLLIMKHFVNNKEV